MGRTPELDLLVANNLIAGEFRPELGLPFLQIADTAFLKATLFDMLPLHLGLEGMRPPLIMQAAEIAEKKLACRVRKKHRWDGMTIPDVNHSYRVAIRLVRAGITDEATISAALLHDVIEDSNTTEAELESELSQYAPQILASRVTRTVSLLSKNHNNKGPTKSSEKYYKDIKTEPDEIVRRMAIQIKYADRTDNLTCFVYMDLGRSIDEPGDEIQRGISTLEALQQNITETNDFFDENFDPDNEFLYRRLGAARRRADNAVLDFDLRMQ